MKVFKYSMSMLMAMLLSTACSNAPKEATPEQEVYTYKVSTDTPAGTFVDSIDYFCLQHTDGKTLGRPEKISRCGDNIVIADYRQKMIFVYDGKSGEQKFVIDAPGKGPGEYVGISSMATDKDNIYILDNRGKQLLCYSGEDGKFLWAKTTPIYASDFEVLDNGGFLFAFHVQKNGNSNTTQDAARLYVTDSDLNITSTYFPYADGEYDVIGQRYLLTKNQGKIIFGSVMIDGFTEIDAADPSKQRQIVFDFPNGLAGSGCEDIREIDQYQFLSLPPFVVGNNYIISYRDETGRSHASLWNSETKEFYNDSMADLSKAIMPILGALDNQFVAYMDDYGMYQAATQAGFAAGSPEVAEHLKNEGAVLVRYTMK